jgi:NAD(P)-dependent dehydrogenase (short-subunit alcohol dehydrogenase family)
MVDKGALLVTGGSGTVGTALLPPLMRRFTHIVSVGRQRPIALRNTDRFLRADLASPSGIEAACIQLAGPIGGVVLAAGVDSRASLGALTTAELETCMRVNCLAQLRLLGVATALHTGSRPLPLVVISSDVVGQRLPGTVAYAASKAALEEGVRHALTDNSALTVLIVRLGDIGVPMIQVNGTRPAHRAAPSDTLEDVIQRASAFLTDPPPPLTLEVLSDARVHHLRR